MFKDNLKIIISLIAGIFYILFSWILIHVFAFFGVFIALAFPIWWMIAPKLSICFGCRLKKEGEICPYCNERVSKAQGYYPKNFKSVIKNIAIIILISLASIGLVFLEYRLLTIYNNSHTQVNTTEFVIPNKSTYKIGQIFPMKIEISGVRTPINVVQADVGYPKDLLEVVDVSIEGSFAKIFIDKEINNESGYTRLTGGLPYPGLNVERGMLGTIYFKAKKAGLAQVAFLKSSLVLANDGKGTNTLKDYPIASYVVTPEHISQTEEEIQNNMINKQVLGANTTIDNDTLVFFNNDNKGISLDNSLNATQTTVVNRVSSNSFTVISINILHTIDSVILSPYNYIYNTLSK